MSSRCSRSVIWMVLGITACISGVLIAQDRPAYLPDRLSSKFSTYRDKPKHRAFALGRNGAWGFGFGHATIKEAREHALSICREHSSDCVVIAVNERIVVNNPPFPPSDTGGENRWIYYVPLIVLFGIISYVLLSRYKHKQGSDPDVDPIRERSFRVNCSADRVVQQAKRIAENNTEFALHDTDGYTVILNTYPTFLSDGHFFWIRAKSLSSDITEVHIQTRPRMFRFWHWFATRETNKVYETLRNALADDLVEPSPSGT